MKGLKGISLLGLTTFFLLSCGGGGAENNEFVNQLPADQKAAYIKKTDAECACFGKMKGDPSEMEDAAKVLETKVDEFVIAINANDYERAKVANDATNEAQKAYKNTEKKLREKNVEVTECIKNIETSLSDTDRELIKEADKKIRELAIAKFGETPESRVKRREMGYAMCPMAKKMVGESVVIMERIYEKRGPAMNLYREMEMKANMNGMMGPAPRNNTEEITD